jgi:hypothetical protein
VVYIPRYRGMYTTHRCIQGIGGYPGYPISGYRGIWGYPRDTPRIPPFGGSSRTPLLYSRQIGPKWPYLGGFWRVPQGYPQIPPYLGWGGLGHPWGGVSGVYTTYRGVYTTYLGVLYTGGGPYWVVRRGFPSMVTPSGGDVPGPLNGAPGPSGTHSCQEGSYWAGGLFGPSQGRGWEGYLGDMGYIGVWGHIYWGIWGGGIWEGGETPLGVTNQIPYPAGGSEGVGKVGL